MQGFLGTLPRKPLPHATTGWRLNPIAAVLALGVLGLPAGIASAATISVTTTDQVNAGACTLSDAIRAANTNAAVGGCPAGFGPDTLVFPANSTFSFLTPEGDANNGLPFITSEIVIQGNGSTIRRDPAAPSTFRVLALQGSANLTLQQTTISGGIANGFDGGGIAVESDSARLTITNSTVSGNAARNGGGLFNGAGTVILSNSTVSGNSASSYGGGIHNNSDAFSNRYGTVTMTNSTVSGNRAGRGGGGIYLIGPLTISNSIVSGNTADQGSELYRFTGGVTSSFNLFGHAGLSTAQALFNESPKPNDIAATVDGNRPTVLANILAPLALNAPGSTATHALVPNSPAIDAAGSGCLATDQRGIARPRGAACDMGAYEQVPSSFVVNTLADSDDGTCNAAHCTLREAISAGNAAAPISAVITFNIPGGGTILLGSTLPVLTNTTGMSISGPATAADAITISGGTNPLGASNVRLIRMASGTVLNIDHLSLINGLNAGFGRSGGAISVGTSGNGTLNVRQCRFINNRAGGVGFAIDDESGGAIAAYTATVTIADSVFIGNSSTTNGAAITAAGTDIDALDTRLNVSRSLFSGNTAVGGSAIFAKKATLAVSNSTFFNNAGARGEAILTATLPSRVQSLKHNTFVGGRALIVEPVSDPATLLSLSNNLLGGGCLLEGGAMISDLGGNIAPDASCDFTQASSLVRSASEVNLAPALADNGGPTQTLALQTGSVAVDAAPNCASQFGDQRGVIRPQGAACDSGAFEATQGNLLAVKTASHDSIPVGGSTTFTLSARNLAPAPDIGASLSDTVPGTLSITSVTPLTAGVLCPAPVGNLVTCTLPSLAQNGVASVQIATTANAEGDASNTVTVRTGADVDIDPADDSDTAQVTVELDTTPEAFTFPSRTNVERGSYQLSDEVTLSGIDFPTPFLVTNGMASINGGACERIDEPVADGDRLRLCHTASTDFGTDTVTTVTVGTYQTTFTSTTEARDITPDAFSFASRADVAPGSLQTSAAITVSGINDPAPFFVTGGFATVGAGPCTQTSGTVSNGDSVRVCHTASANFSTATTTRLTIGADGVLTGVFADFTSTTVGAPALTVDRASLSFGNQRVGVASASMNITLRNTGGSQLQILSIGTDNGDFLSTTTCLSTLGPNADCYIFVRFQPSAAGPASGILSIVSDDPTNPQKQIPLSGTGIDPQLALDPGSLSFGNQRVDTTSGLLSFTVRNPGTDALTISSISVNGDYLRDGGNCGTSVVAGGQCTVGVRFMPTATGARPGSVAVATDAGMQSVTLSGTGVEPQLALDPGTLSFGNQRVDTTSGLLSFTVRNPGTDMLAISSISVNGDYLRDGGTCGTSVVAGGQCTVGVRFMPTATGARPGSVSVATDAGTQAVTLSGTGVEPQLALDPGALSFGNQRVDTTSELLSFTVRNPGTDSLAISSITVNGDYLRDGGTCGTSVAAGGQCTVGVRFMPTATGARPGSVSVATDAGTQAVTLSGTGIEPQAAVDPASLDFGTVRTDRSSPAQSFSLSNPGTDALTISSIGVSGDYARSGGTCGTSVAAGESCTVSVVFTPSAAGSRPGLVTLVTDAGSRSVDLAGIGRDPVAGTVQFSAPVYSVGEAGVQAEILVTRSGGSETDIAATFSTANGSAMAGSDYTAASELLSWLDGDSTPRIVHVSINNDTLDEPNETVALNLSAAPGTVLGSPSGATLSIVDNDDTPTVRFTAATQNVGEAAGTATVSLQLSALSSLPVTVPLSFGGSASNPGDYNGVPASVTIPAGQMGASFSFNLVNDTAFESSETVVVNMGSPGNAIPGSPSSQTLTIVDDDAQAVANITVTPATDTKLTLNQHCVTATTRDSVGTLLPSIPLSFAVTGVNPTTGAATTNGTGTASFCFNGTNGGTDSIKVSFGSQSGTASIVWNKRNTGLTVTPVPAVIVTQGLQLRIVLSPKATLKDSTTNAPVAGKTVSFKAGTTALCTAVTNASGVATCQANVAHSLAGLLSLGYTGTYTGDGSYNASTGNGGILGLTLF
ncbi:MAG: choice-of-anchor D domain-containing protein [Panacagrimonas sp.]